MAVIISPYVGDARGKLGAAVYMRSKGQTLVRGYNPSPLNRRTVSQQGQRAVFSSAVRFYSRGVQNLFQFAFEDKRTKESDYNAFMRYNAKLGPYYGPEQNGDDSYPALAPWVLTRGSLVGKEVQWNVTPYVVFGWIASSPGNTVAALSRAIIASDSNYEEGDILTFLSINTWRQPGSSAQPYGPNDGEVPEWTIMQLILDTTDDTQLTSPYWRISYDSAEGVRLFGTGQFNGSSFASAAGYVHSRVRNGKVYVSDAVLSLNSLANLAYNYGRSQVWYDKVMLAWGAEQASILQGSIARRAAELNPDYVSYPFSLPSDVDDIDGGVVKINMVVTAAQVVEHLKIIDNEGDLYIGSVGDDDIINYSRAGTSSVAFNAHYVLSNGYVTLTLESISGGVIQSIGWE